MLAQAVFAEQLDANVAVIDERAIGWLDEEARGSGFDERLFQAAPAQDLRARLDIVVALLRDVDMGALTSRQGMIARMTGADVEARLRFELSTETIAPAMRGASVAAQRARQFRTTLIEAQDTLAAQQVRLADVIERANHLLIHGRQVDELITARYQRRLANLTALHVANDQARMQFDLAEDVIVGLIDRFNDVETMLFPLWQRCAAALAHASDRHLFKQCARTFGEAHAALLASLEKAQ